MKYMSESIAAKTINFAELPIKYTTLGELFIFFYRINMIDEAGSGYSPGDCILYGSCTSALRGFYVGSVFF